MKELTKKCIELLTSILLQLGQSRSMGEKEIFLFAEILAKDLVRHYPKLSWDDVQEAFNNGIRSGDFHISVPNYYKWLDNQKKLIDEELWKERNQETYTHDKRLEYRSKKGTGIKTITNLINKKLLQ